MITNTVTITIATDTANVNDLNVAANCSRSAINSSSKNELAIPSNINIFKGEGAPTVPNDHNPSINGSNTDNSAISDVTNIAENTKHPIDPMSAALSAEINKRDILRAEGTYKGSTMYDILKDADERGDPLDQWAAKDVNEMYDFMHDIEFVFFPFPGYVVNPFDCV